MVRGGMLGQLLLLAGGARRTSGGAGDRLLSGCERRGGNAESHVELLSLGVLLRL